MRKVEKDEVSKDEDENEKTFHFPFDNDF